MSHLPLCAMLIHVGDVAAGLDWYARALPRATRQRLEWSGGVVDYIDVDGFMVEIVAADDKVAAGAAGSVVYWTTADFDATLAHLLACGATLYRGPGEIERGQRMCQVRDPWGNCIGLRG